MLICTSIVRCRRFFINYFWKKLPGNPKLNIQIVLLLIACESILILFEFQQQKKLAMIIKAKMC